MRGFTGLFTVAVLSIVAASSPAAAQPELLDPNLGVRTVVSGLITPVSMAFLGGNDLLVLEKNTGRVQRVVNGALHSTVLDLAVNFRSERGLLGIALHPRFAMNRFVYLYWTQSSTGADTDVAEETPLLGNRVDRYIWTGTTLVFERNIIRLRSLQGQAGNHNGGVLRYGRGKLHVIVGDVNRLGQLQNVPDGPAPDNANVTSVILRLNANGTAPPDNPFFDVGAGIGGEVGANIQKIYAYGIRNSFGMAFDPIDDHLWIQSNGPSSFDELERVVPGLNSGWQQVMGPISRVAEFQALQPGMDIAETPAEARSRLFMLPGARYSDPEFSWKHAVAPGGIGFLASTALGAQYQGGLFVGAASSSASRAGGYLFHFRLSDNRRTFALSDPDLADRVADNLSTDLLRESDSLLFGRNFGIGTDIQTGPNGNLYVVSLSAGAIYEIFRR